MVKLEMCDDTRRIKPKSRLGTTQFNLALYCIYVICEQHTTKAKNLFYNLLVDPVPMTEKHKKIITSNLSKLGNLNADGVMIILVENGIFTVDEMAEVDAKPTPTMKAIFLMRLLLRKQDRGFYILIDALKNKGSPELASILEMGGGIFHFLPVQMQELDLC